MPESFEHPYVLHVRNTIVAWKSSALKMHNLLFVSEIKRLIEPMNLISNFDLWMFLVSCIITQILIHALVPPGAQLWEKLIKNEYGMWRQASALLHECCLMLLSVA